MTRRPAEDAPRVSDDVPAASANGDDSARRARSLTSRVLLTDLLARFDEPIPPRFYRQVAKLRVACVSVLMVANILGSSAALFRTPSWNLEHYLAHQAVILCLGVVEIVLGWIAWRVPMTDVRLRRLTLAATGAEIAILMVGLHGLGSVNSHLVSLAVLAVVLYRLLFDITLASAMLAMMLAAHWTLVLLEGQRLLRPQMSLPELDMVYREPAWQFGTMAVVTAFYIVGFVMAHWAVLRLRRREVALRVLREAFAAVDPERIGELTGAVLASRYEVRELLGRGGSSEVYAGLHLRTRRPVAIKVLAERLANRAEALARFRREAEITGQLRCPEIVEILDVDEDGGYPFLVLELLRGEDLRAWVRREGPIPPEQAVSLTASVAAALDAAHASGVVHRDLKPANVFLSETDRGRATKLLDFGIARPESSGVDTLTRDAELLGTPAFMAPEQLSPSVGAISAATDVFALGATLYFALSGRLPYPSDLAPAALAASRHHRPDPLATSRPELAPALDDVLLVAMAARPEDRFRSAGALAEAFRAALENRLPDEVARAAATERRARPLRSVAPSDVPTVDAPTLTSTLAKAPASS